MDLNYLLLRQQTERSRAESATSTSARRIHEQLASEYERLIEGATQGRVKFIAVEAAHSGGVHASGEAAF